MIVNLGGVDIPVFIERKNNKNIYFRFKEDTLYVTCNRWVSDREVEKLIYQNEESLAKMVLKVQKRNDNEKQFSYLGKPLVKVFDESVKDITIEDDFIYAKNERAFNKWYKEECLNIFKKRIEYLLPYFDNIPKFSLRIRAMKTRWGVNNVTKKIITLNSELLKRDVALIDYVIVHELCHFYEANHSSRFWYQVSLRYPNYKWARKCLRG